jgi:hypothetical protein
MKKYNLVIIIIIFLIGCISSHQDIIIDDLLYQSASRDPITINNIQLIVDVIRFNISYGGGCKEHKFQLISTSFMESYPVQVNIILSHEDNEDPCDMWITETLTFNLLPLKELYKKSYYEKSGTIIMNIDEWNEPLNYEF